MTEKTCICCRQIKPLDAYSSHKQMKDGRLNKCKSCCVAYIKNYRAGKSKNELQSMRRLEYESSIKSGSRTRGRSLLEIREQHDPINRKVSALRYMHKKRVASNHTSEFCDLVFDEAVRLCHMRAAATGSMWQIDHIVPIRAKFACGLHNAFNLQVVPKQWNEKKWNKHAGLFFPRSEIGY